MTILNHRERRALAKRRAKKETCSTHPTTRLVVKGTQVICPMCYYELQIKKHQLKLAEEKEVTNVKDEPTV